MTDEKNTPNCPANALSRRHFLKNTARGSAGLASATTLVSASTLTGALSGCQQQQTLSFEEIAHRLDHHHHAPNGYQTQRLLSWGDSLHRQDSFTPDTLTPAAQAQRFGFNNDFIGFMPLSNQQTATGYEHFTSSNSQRGLLCVNHEYTQPHLMFSGYRDDEDGDFNTRPEHVAIEQQACGHSVVEIELQNGHWQVNTDSPYNRRITVTTPMIVTGPAAGHPRLQTSQDPSGARILGTLGNCAGGKTPWGTVMIAEEGIGSAFIGNRSNIPKTEQDNYQRLAIGNDDNRRWGDVDPRFHIEKEPNEANRFGWMVELDPYDPESTPRKLTSLGRFEHEGTTIVAKPGKPIVAYTGDDDEFQFFYKFVSAGVYQPEQPAANRQLLEQGTLYAAKLNDDGSGEWLSLRHGEAFLTEQFGFHSQADVLIECRRAAAMIGATPMDRPEDIETNPVNDCTYVMLTKNKKRKTQDPGNMRLNNSAGHILELLHPGKDGQRDHTAHTFQWNTFILGGDPGSDTLNNQGFYGTGPNGETVSDAGWFATPDNLTFDRQGNMWVATDGCEAFGFHDGLWAMPTAGPYRAIPKHFFGCPLGAELCGPEFTPDGNTLFVSVQHPADAHGSTFDHPVHRWPDFDEALPPRPSVIAIRRKDGGRVGS
ncbi:PhoX family phosphatase [Aestuariicella hydrocarbonica]|uniref:PhoX family phosphatase n=1 Tax=Pseudomaricurvus hydrocarbonicus TaxID=1470433 RepID=A0A9E5MM12_9GAMM|nr:PhoX family phosphatase [Aestuariicella hydrocarbonica]NHO65195.1 PhoX family phosphatase [Aestuariicella hydrocarbonica]